MGNIETQKPFHFKFHSSAIDIGEFKKTLMFYRKRPRLDTALINTKSVLAGGLPPLTNADAIFLDAIATLTVYMDPIDDQGAVVKNAGWIDLIYDNEILLALYNEWLIYQNSFYKKPEVASGDNKTSL